MVRPVIICFARAPRLGQGKQRLAREIGAVPALRFQRIRLSAVLRALSTLRGVDKYLSLTPPGARVRTPAGWQVMSQGHGDLGARMHHLFQCFPGRRVVLLGTDIPALGAPDIRAALRALRGHDAVFGPAFDGGYYLVGLAPRRPARPFAQARWSSEHALADTLRNFAGFRVACLRRLRDIDTAEDLAAYL